MGRILNGIRGGGELAYIKPEALIRVENVFVIITVTGHHYLSIKNQLQEMGIPHLTYMEYILAAHFDEFETVYHQLLDDECSRKTYLSVLMSRLTCDMAYLREVFVKNQYFEVPEFYGAGTKDIFVDCGAYVGDTLENFIVNRAGLFEKVYSFEPAEKTYKALCKRKRRLLDEWALDEGQIIAEQKIVSDSSGFLAFLCNAAGESSNRIIKNDIDAEKRTESVSLDDYFGDKEGKPTFIKADIEGAEMDLIKGARNIIEDSCPLLSICIYHKAEDLYEIPLMLKRLNPGYKMAVRHHMPNYYETVLYCY